MGTILSIEWDKRLEGIGSDWQVGFGEDKISYLISSKDAGSNDENVGGNVGNTEQGFTLINERLKWRVSILSLKNEFNWSTECIVGEICWNEFNWFNILSMEC